MDDDITKKHLKSSVIPIGKTTDRMTLKFFQQTIILLKVDCFEGRLKLTEWQMIIQAAVTHSNFKKST